uniref:PDZ domain-containing protein n=1 Tax=Anopheles funestus TaxID=62324 RepID=A0A4Y0BNM9_ANOFN
MVLDLNFSRYDNTTPFGFKLVGGADFDVPLTVVKILPGSIAEDVGMHIGDVVVRINDIPTGNMSYYDAHQLLACAGNQFVLGILRAREVTPSQRLIKEKTPSGEVEYINTSPKPFWTPNVGSPCQLGQSKEARQMEEQVSEVPITDEQIAEVLSGEAEVLKQHNVIGVNFNKMIPKAGVFKQSEVFKTLNSELVESEEEDKKWTTFLQRPARPPPKTPEEKKLERNPPTERYQVRIVKQPKPKIAPDYKPPKSPLHCELSCGSIAYHYLPPPNFKEPEPEPEPIPMYDEYLNERQEVEVETIKTLVEESIVLGEPKTGDAEGGTQPEATSPSEEEPTEEFREQLQNVQKQLEALSALPNTIQATIAALTEQLAALAAPKRKSKSISPRPEEAEAKVGESTEQSAAPDGIVPEVSETFEVTEFSRADSSGGDQSSSVDEGEHIQYTEEELELLEKRMKEHDIEWTNQNDKKPKYQTIEWAIVSQRYRIYVDEEEEIEYVTIPLRITEELVACGVESSEAIAIEPQPDSDSSSQNNASGDIRTAVQDELKLQVVKKKKKAVSAFGPLTPQERPIFLPGGRKWRTAKDAFNEQFIAEVISSQAELIQGTTLGVNFLKYQKPEKDLSFIKNSDVYKLVHDMDPPKSGIELRPEMVVAEEDVRKCASPC